MTPTSSGKNWRTESTETSQTITTEPAPTGNQGGDVVGERIVYENHAQDSRVKKVDIAPCLKARSGTGGGNLPLVAEENPQGVDLFNQTLTGDIHVPPSNGWWTRCTGGSRTDRLPCHAGSHQQHRGIPSIGNRKQGWHGIIGRRAGSPA